MQAVEQAVTASNHHPIGINWAPCLARDIWVGLNHKLRAGKPIDENILQHLNPDLPFYHDLFKNSPWVYRHSVIVGSGAASTAAKLKKICPEVKINPDLMRLLGYIHDGGKMGDNGKDDDGKMSVKLYCEESGQGSRAKPKVVESFSDVMTMLAHPRRSQTIAWLYGFPDVACYLVGQHHGTAPTMIQMTENVRWGHPEEVFCYPGPRPNDPHSLILMCADSFLAFFENKMDARLWPPNKAPERFIAEKAKIIHGELLAKEQLDEKVLSLPHQKIIFDGLQEFLIKFYTGMRLFGTPRAGERVSLDGRLPWPEYSLPVVSRHNP
jgi:putative nucleotidyltransferase with HDIG domain